MLKTMEIEPTKKIFGSAFVGSTINSCHPISSHYTDTTKIVSLSEWCNKNFISRDVGYTLIKKKFLIGFRRHQVWWVAANPECIEELLEYLGVEELIFDADNS